MGTFPVLVLHHCASVSWEVIIELGLLCSPSTFLARRLWFQSDLNQSLNISWTHTNLSTRRCNPFCSQACNWLMGLWFMTALYFNLTPLRSNALNTIYLSQCGFAIWMAIFEHGFVTRFHIFSTFVVTVNLFGSHRLDRSFSISRNMKLARRQPHM